MPAINCMWVPREGTCLRIPAGMAPSKRSVATGKVGWATYCPRFPKARASKVKMTDSMEHVRAHRCCVRRQLLPSVAARSRRPGTHPPPRSPARVPASTATDKRGIKRGRRTTRSRPLRILPQTAANRARHEPQLSAVYAVPGTGPPSARLASARRPPP